MSDDKQLLGDIDMTLNCGEPFIPINPETNEPYYQSIFKENDAVWIERPALQDKPYLMAFFSDKSIKELEAMFRQEPNIEAPSNSKK